MDKLTQANIERFNEIAAEWDTDPRRAAVAEAVAGAILQAVPPSGDERALELMGWSAPSFSASMSQRGHTGTPDEKEADHHEY